MQMKYDLLKRKCQLVPTTDQMVGNLPEENIFNFYLIRPP